MPHLLLQQEKNKKSLLVISKKRLRSYSVLQLQYLIYLALIYCKGQVASAANSFAAFKGK